MDIARTAVTHALSVELIDTAGAATPVQAELHYDQRDPYAVSALFSTVSSRVRWVLSRDLLADGIYDPSGDGDVHVWPCLDVRGSAVVIIELCSPDGEALLQVPSSELIEFIRRTYDLVPRGSEGPLIDVEGAIAQLLMEPG